VRRVLERLSVFIVAAGVPLCAWAQSTQQLRDRDPDLAGAKKVAAEIQQANFHWGRFYLMSRFRLSDAGYNETSYLPTSDTSGGLSLSVEAPHRLYYEPHRKTVFTAELIPAYHVVGRNLDGEDRISYLARGDAHFLFNHLYLDLYTQRADQLRAYAADVNVLARTRENETGLGGEWKYSSRTSGTFALRYRDSVYPEDRFGPGETPMALLDRNERNGRLAFHHRTFPLTSLFVAAEVSDYGFDNASYKEGRRQFYSVGANYDNGRTQLRAEVGPASLDFRAPEQRDFKGVLGSVGGSRAYSRWVFSARASRDLGFSIYVNNNYYIADSAYAGINYTATRRLTLRANSTYEIDNYDVPVNGRDRRDTISFTSVGFIYGVRRLRAGADVGWYERDSTNEGDVDSGIRYVLHLSYIP
jgi:hypothetical protein